MALHMHTCGERELFRDRTRRSRFYLDVTDLPVIGTFDHEVRRSGKQGGATFCTIGDCWYSGLPIVHISHRAHMRNGKNQLLRKCFLMTCRIERLASGNDMVVLLVSGRLQLEHVDTIRELLGEECRGAMLDLVEVTLVDREVVTFLAACELKGIELRNCPAFLREWITREQSRD